MKDEQHDRSIIDGIGVSALGQNCQLLIAKKLAFATAGVFSRGGVPAHSSGLLYLVALDAWAWLVIGKTVPEKRIAVPLE